jgi:hypothetical protein
MTFSVYRGSELHLLQIHVVDFGTLSLTPPLSSAVGGITLTMTYGIHIEETNDPFIKLAETVGKAL